MGAHAEKAADIAELETMIVEARSRDIPSVIVIDTDAVPGTDAGGHWWDVAVPQSGGPERLEQARAPLQRERCASADLQLMRAAGDESHPLPTSSRAGRQIHRCRRDAA